MQGEGSRRRSLYSSRRNAGPSWCIQHPPTLDYPCQFPHPAEYCQVLSGIPPAQASAKRGLCLLPPMRVRLLAVEEASVVEESSVNMRMLPHQPPCQPWNRMHLPAEDRSEEHTSELQS